MKKFRKVYVEITNICNMNCSFCPDTKRAKATMSLEKFEHVAKQIKQYTDYIYLHVKGEPLLHPNLKEILDICKKYDLKVNISTNATLLGKKYMFLKEIRQLNISLHSFEGEDESKHIEYLQSTLDICDELASGGVIIRYKLWNHEKENVSKNKKTIELINRRYNTEIVDTVYIKDKKLKDNIFLSIKIPFEWPTLDGGLKKETTCYGIRRQIAILVDGTVVPCCVDNDGEIALGNIYETNLDNILNSELAKKIKKGFEDNKCVHELCKKCEYRIRVT